jgi:hypothetical protein
VSANVSAGLAAPGLRQLLAFTLTAPNVRSVAEAYARWLDYVIAEETTLSTALAAVWDCPALVGQRMILLHAASGTDTWLRLVEMPAASPPVPLLGHGWNAMEVLVQDPYQLARELQGSPFRVVIPPRPLPFDADIHAMQVIGPAGELLYMTALPANKTLLDLRAAKVRVDRPFIAILGGANTAAMLSFYASQLLTPVIAPTPTIVQIINEQFALPVDHRVPLGIVKLPRDCLIEIDGLPAAARPRQRRDGELHRGFAMVTFSCSDFAALALPWLHPPVLLAHLSDRAKRVAVTVGAAGEWIELIET